jgi:hypothetical protein
MMFRIPLRELPHMASMLPYVTLGLFSWILDDEGNRYASLYSRSKLGDILKDSENSIHLSNINNHPCYKPAYIKHFTSPTANIPIPPNRIPISPTPQCPSSSLASQAAPTRAVTG